MPTRWGKPSSKETKKKTCKESIIDTLHRKFAWRGVKVLLKGLMLNPFHFLVCTLQV